MRRHLLLIALLAAPAHAELSGRDDLEIHIMSAQDASISYHPFRNANLFLQALCWVPTSLNANGTGHEISLCGAAPDSEPSAGRELSRQFTGFSNANWSVVTYPGLGAGAMTLIPGAGYQLLRETAASQTHTDNETRARLSSMPLAALTWFLLGCTLGALALVRRNREARYATG